MNLNNEKAIIIYRKAIATAVIVLEICRINYHEKFLTVLVYKSKQRN